MSRQTSGMRNEALGIGDRASGIKNEASEKGNESPKDQNISEPNESGILGSKEEQHALQERSEASGMRTNNRQLWEWNTTSRMEMNTCGNEK